MAATQRPLTTQTTAAVLASTPLSEAGRQVLDQLYQPILGVTAYSLVTTLWSQVRLGSDFKLELTHADLLKRLNVGLQDLITARKRLEGAGLLKTYLNQPDHLPELMYELQQPVSGALFFKDDLLSLLLLEVVGERQFNQLKWAFLPRQINRDGWQEISQSFLDVFSVDNRLIANPPQIIESTKAEFNESVNTTIGLTGEPLANDFDFELLVEIAKRSYLNLADIQQYRQLIVNEHMLYGINETDMARLLGQATNLATNQLDEAQFKRLVAKDYQAQTQGAMSVKPVQQTTAQDKPDNRPRVSEQEAAIIDAAKAYEPMNFLATLHQQKGGFVTNFERIRIENLAKAQVLPAAVINMLIYHILIDLDRPTVDQNRVDEIANTWAQKGVKTPEAAIEEIHRYADTQRKKGQTRTGNRRQPVKNVKETLPDWAKEDYQPKPKAELTQAEKDQFNAQMAELKKLRNGGESNGQH